MVTNSAHLFKIDNIIPIRGLEKRDGGAPKVGMRPKILNQVDIRSLLLE